MSGYAVRWAFRMGEAHPDLSSPAHHLLLCLADRFNDKKREAWPSVADIKKRIHQSPKSIQRHTKELEEAGLIEVHPLLSSTRRKIGLKYKFPEYDPFREKELTSNSFDHKGKYDPDADDRSDPWPY